MSWLEPIFAAVMRVSPDSPDIYSRRTPTALDCSNGLNGNIIGLIRITH